jgi:hypothetical protein
VGVFYGPLSADLVMADANRTVLGEPNVDEEFGRNGVGGRGDVDGDGLDDVLASAQYDSTYATYAGSAYLIAGSSSATGSTSASSATASFYAEGLYEVFGFSLDLGDVDGDGLADVVVAGEAASADYTTSGAVYVFYGPVAGAYMTSDAGVRYSGAAAADQLGIGLSARGDMDSDGQADLWMGAWGTDVNGSSSGSAYLFP